MKWLEDDKHVAVIRTVGVQDERQPRHGHRVGNAGRLESDLLDRLGHLDRALERGRVGQLHVHHQIALILDRDELAGNPSKAEARQTDQAEVDQEHERALAEATAHGLAVGFGRAARTPS